MPSNFQADPQVPVTGTLHHLSRYQALRSNPDARAFPTPQHIRRDLRILTPEYFCDRDGQIHVGQIVVHEDLIPSLEIIFPELLKMKFPITIMVPISAFHWDDELSMRSDNTSGYNNRFIASTVDTDNPRPSMHAFGRAIDLNPRRNPCRSEGIWVPQGAKYNPERPGTIARNSSVAALFKDHGYRCGVDWEDPFDPQHVELPLAV